MQRDSLTSTFLVLGDQAMLRMEKDSNGYASALRLCGRIQSDRIACIRAAMTEGCAPKILDLREVTLVDVAVVHFLMSCEDNGIELLHCPPYVREWILRERAEAQPEPAHDN